jgi:hypothetical protein
VALATLRRPSANALNIELTEEMPDNWPSRETLAAAATVLAGKA